MKKKKLREKDEEVEEDETVHGDFGRVKKVDRVLSQSRPRVSGFIALALIV